MCGTAEQRTPAEMRRVQKKCLQSSYFHGTSGSGIGKTQARALADNVGMAHYTASVFSTNHTAEVSKCPYAGEDVQRALPHPGRAC